MGGALQKKLWQFLKKLVTFDPAMRVLRTQARERTRPRDSGYRNVCSSFTHTAGDGTRALSGRLINRTWSVHPVQHYSVLQRDQVLIGATVSVNLENHKLNEKKPDTYCTIHFIGHGQTGKSRDTESRCVVARGRGEGKERLLPVRKTELELGITYTAQLQSS